MNNLFLKMKYLNLINSSMDMCGSYPCTMIFLGCITMVLKTQITGSGI